MLHKKSNYDENNSNYLYIVWNIKAKNKYKNEH